MKKLSLALVIIFIYTTNLFAQNQIITVGDSMV